MIHTRPRRKLWDNSDGGRSFPEFQERVCGVAGAAVVGRSWPPAAEDLPRSSREFTSGQPQTCQQHKQQQWRKGEKRQKKNGVSIAGTSAEPLRHNSGRAGTTIDKLAVRL